MTEVICGIDVSSTDLQARIGGDGAEAVFANTPSGVAGLADFCRQNAVTLAVMEATGGYERRPHALLWAEGVPSAVVHPLSVCRYAQAMGLLEKTDRLDAGVIAAFAQARRITAVPPPSEAQQKLREQVRRLRQLTEQQSLQRNQQRLVTDPDVLAGFGALLDLIGSQIRDLEKSVAALIDSDPLWSALNSAMRGIKGVAGRTVARLMADLPEIGTLSGKAVAKLVGLAPIAADSGKHQGRRSIRGGRSTVRSILFFVASVVRRHQPQFTEFAQRLVNAGKPPKVVRTALAHKLLTQLNAKARDARNQLQIA